MDFSKMDLAQINKMFGVPDNLDDDFNDEDLEAELEAIVGKQSDQPTIPSQQQQNCPPQQNVIASQQHGFPPQFQQQIFQPYVPQQPIHPQQQFLPQQSLNLQQQHFQPQQFVPQAPSAPSPHQNIMTEQLNQFAQQPQVQDIVKQQQFPQHLIQELKNTQQEVVEQKEVKQVSPEKVIAQQKPEQKPIQQRIEQLKVSPEKKVSKEQTEQRSQKVLNSEPQPSASNDEELPEMNAEEASKIFNAPPAPKTVLEALEQRIAKFKQTQEQAKTEENQAKVRRLGRIIKQYETAIKTHKAGKPVDYEELPAPPGFAPIPIEKLTHTQMAKPQTQVTRPQQKLPPKTSQTIGAQRPTGQALVQKPQTTAQRPEITKAKVAPNPPVPPPRQAANKRQSSIGNKQMNYLLERQKLFKEAALESKQKGDFEQAKHYLRCARGFDPLIEATQNGLPIDATSIPTPPQLVGEDFVMVSNEEVISEATDVVEDMERGEIFKKIESELKDQIAMCKRNQDYFLQLGDVSTASKFEKYSIDSKKDMAMLLARWRNGDKIPSFKYETRSFSIVICNPDVGTNEVSIEIVKAIDLPRKSDVDTYVRIEFPVPNHESPQTGRTKTVKNTINPVFNEEFKFPIDRKSRSLARIFKRHPIKLEVVSKGGFFKGDNVIGAALIKLSDFETKCTIYDTFPLVEGRKVVGGRIEAKVRIREPLLAKQIEEVKEKWLIFT